MQPLPLLEPRTDIDQTPMIVQNEVFVYKDSILLNCSKLALFSLTVSHKELLHFSNTVVKNIIGQRLALELKD